MKKQFIIFAILTSISFFGYFLYASRPLAAEPWQWADDGLYWQQAIQIKKWLAGKSTLWLGEYSQTTLVKAPLFAIFLVVVNLSGIPLHVVEFLLLILLAVLLIKAIEPVFPTSCFDKAIIVFITICCPYLPDHVRLLRDVLAFTLIGYSLVCWIGLLSRAGLSGRRQEIWSALSGLFVALYYLCREEGAWLLIPAFLVVGFTSIVALKKRRFLQSALVPTIFLSAFFAPVVLVCALNYQSYGAFVTTDRRAPEFTNAFKLMASLEPKNARRFVPMPEATRKKVYPFSSALAKLEPYLEGKQGDATATNPGHIALNEAQLGDREFFVSYFEFALREAVWASGARTFQDQENFWKSVTEQIEAAVVCGELAQGSRPLGLCAPLREGDMLKIINSTFNSFISLFLLRGADIPLDPRSSGNESDVANMGALTNTRLAPMKSLDLELPKETPIRSNLFHISNKIVQMFYLISLVTPFFLIFEIIKNLFARKVDPLQVRLFFSGLLSLGTLALFCLMMGVLDVCGWPHLKYPASYNSLGIILLTIFSCIGFSQLVYLFKINYNDKKK